MTEKDPNLDRYVTKPGDIVWLPAAPTPKPSPPQKQTLKREGEG